MMMTWESLQEFGGALFGLHFVDLPKNVYSSLTCNGSVFGEYGVILPSKLQAIVFVEVLPL